MRVTPTSHIICWQVTQEQTLIPLQFGEDFINRRNQNERAQINLNSNAFTPFIGKKYHKSRACFTCNGVVLSTYYSTFINNKCYRNTQECSALNLLTTSAIQGKWQRSSTFYKWTLPTLKSREVRKPCAVSFGFIRPSESICKAIFSAVNQWRVSPVLRTLS